ncbi:MAG: lytic transglycosylase domain-containing protein [Crocinitomicaceae bacterium]|nr:MAG: lytic transglycosylase domain-containing protein [Crocinitomicaceae bacterium]
MKRGFLFTVGLALLGCTQPDTTPNVSTKAFIQTPDAPQSIPNLPEYMYFAGEKIILEDEDIIERLDREVLTNAYYQSATIQIFKRANRWFPLIERILKEEHIPTDFKYLAVIESGLVQAVSPVGAQGFWQFMPYTAKEHALEISSEVDERLHIEKSTRAACAYLHKAQDTLKDWLLASASYNRGIGGVRQDMRWQGTSHYFDTDQNSETARYVFRILAFKLIFENPAAYGFDLNRIELYEPYQTKSVTIRESIPNLAKWAIEQGINFKILTKLNPWLKSNKLTIKNKTYQLLLPAESENLKPYKHYLQ